MHADEEVLLDAEAIPKDLGKYGWLNVRGFALRQTHCRFRGAGRQVDRPKRNCNWHLSESSTSKNEQKSGFKVINATSPKAIGFEEVRMLHFLLQ